MRSHQLGKEGEAFALEFLRGRGHHILEQNYRPKLGEVDIVARDGEATVFIEVKTRQDDVWDAFEAVDRRKQAKMVRVAQAYLIEKFNKVEVSARFDVLAVYRDSQGRLAGELLQDAFGC
jgi:putative endonuclease